MIECIGSTCRTISRLFITKNKFDSETIILALESSSDDDLSHHSVKAHDFRCWLRNYYEVLGIIMGLYPQMI